VIKDRYPPDPQAYDPVADVVLRCCWGEKGEQDLTGLWIFDQAGKSCRKSASPLPDPQDPQAKAYGLQQRTGIAYDPLNREVLFLMFSGAWRYDRAKDSWEQAATGDGSLYVTHGVDPQHNVLLAIRSRQLCAFRYKNVPEGTTAYYGGTAR